jgi:hypothetical protein
MLNSEEFAKATRKLQAAQNFAFIAYTVVSMVNGALLWEMVSRFLGK